MTAKEAGVVVGTLARALLDGSRDLGTVPALLVRIIKEDLWRDREDPVSGRPYRFRSWEEFVTTPGPDGLGSSIEQLRGVCRGNKAALDALDRVEQIVPGQHRANDNVTSSTGNAAATALRRLRKSRPDLHAKVLDGEMSPHRAMVEAGFRHPTVTVPTDDPERLAATLRRRLKPKDLRRLTELLGGP